MQDYADLTRRLADLVVGFGANVQPGQVVAISNPGKEPLCARGRSAAYKHGAKWVDAWTSTPG